MEDTARETLRETSVVGFNSWRHHPLTQMVWGFLEDRYATLRREAADLVEEGKWDTNSPTDLNPFALRGRLAELQDLLRIELPHIRAFYGEETPGEAADDRTGPQAP